MCNRCIPESNYSTFVFVYSKVTQVCNRLDIACICIQRTLENAERVQGFIKKTESQDEQQSERENQDDEEHKKEHEDNERENKKDEERDVDEEEHGRQNKEDKEGGDEGKKTETPDLNTEELLDELSALEHLDSEKTQPQCKHLGLKRITTRSKARAQKQ